ncbi:MAG: PqiC family protein [Comamonadaceae bacterium]|nr:PqiC family protein [Comamonadaceae bacterium]
MRRDYRHRRRCAWPPPAAAATPKARFYTLSAVPAAALGTAASAAAGYGVAVGPITVPEAVDRPQIVLRLSPSQVEISELHRWAAPLNSEIPARSSPKHLTRLLDSARVWAYPGAAGPGSGLSGAAGHRALRFRAG